MNSLTTLFLVGGAALASALSATAQQSAFTVQESRRGFARLQDAIDAVGDGQGTILVAPGRYRQCGVQQAGAITYRAARAASAVFDGATCEGKAALVLRGRAARVEGLTFTNLRVPDGNGAGIRLERGPLEVTQTQFRDSESGILSHDDPAATIRITQSTFSGLGRCDRGLSCAHSIYIGNYRSLIVDRARFERGRGGHYVKSRASGIIVENSSFDDSGGRATNYMIDLSNGARGRIGGNRFVQGPDKENYSAFIMVAAEGRVHSSAGLNIAGNEAALAPRAPRPTAFVADASRDKLAIGANRLDPAVRAFERR